MSKQAAVLSARTQGAVAQYQLAGTNSAASITPAGTGSGIIGTVPPGKAGIVQVDTTIQNAADLTQCGQFFGDNFLACTSQPTANGDPTVNSAQLQSNGLSLSPQHE